jgi:dTDP-4-dehydrorhamnose reductase
MCGAPCTAISAQGFRQVWQFHLGRILGYGVLGGVAAYSVNALGPQNLAIGAGKVGARLVQVSTDYVFSGENTAPWSENAAHNPQSVYGSTKSEGEKFVRAALPTDSYVVRTAWLYSAEGNNFAKTMVNLAINSAGEVKVVNDQLGQPTFAGDLATQIVELVLSGAPVGIYHGTNGGKATWYEFAQEIFESLLRPKMIPVYRLFAEPYFQEKFILHVTK